MNDVRSDAASPLEVKAPSMAPDEVRLLADAIIAALKTVYDP